MTPVRRTPDGALVAAALREVFAAPFTYEPHEPSGIVDAIVQSGETVARALIRLGSADTSTPLGGLESHGQAILDASSTIADAIHDLAEAIREGHRRR